jgi:tetratricopeptide (TPR) repeat protein
MRGQAMILLFMGRIVEAHAAIDRAIAAFDDSGEPERLAARAAGQDAGVANLALKSWTLWLLGQVDVAVTKIEAALARAEAIAHPHSMAYACYYASVLHALRAEHAKATGYADRCLALSEEHGFGQWRGLAHAVHGICMTMLQPSADALKEVMSAMEEYRGRGYQLGITALYVLLCRALLRLGQGEAALELIEQGLATAAHNSERLFEAELLSLKARALRRRGAAADGLVQPLLEQALIIARGQHARSLELRASSELADLLADRGRSEEGREHLAQMLASCREGHDTQDYRDAKLLLARLRP